MLKPGLTVIIVRLCRLYGSTYQNLKKGTNIQSSSLWPSNDQVDLMRQMPSCCTTPSFIVADVARAIALILGHPRFTQPFVTEPAYR